MSNGWEPRSIPDPPESGGCAPTASFIVVHAAAFWGVGIGVATGRADVVALSLSAAAAWWLGFLAGADR